MSIIWNVFSKSETPAPEESELEPNFMSRLYSSQAAPVSQGTIAGLSFAGAAGWDGSVQAPEAAAAAAAAETTTATSAGATPTQLKKLFINMRILVWLGHQERLGSKAEAAVRLAHFDTGARGAWSSASKQKQREGLVICHPQHGNVFVPLDNNNIASLAPRLQTEAQAAACWVTDPRNAALLKQVETSLEEEIRRDGMSRESILEDSGKALERSSFADKIKMCAKARLLHQGAEILDSYYEKNRRHDDEARRRAADKQLVFLVMQLDEDENCFVGHQRQLNLLEPCFFGELLEILDEIYPASASTSERSFERSLITATLDQIIEEVAEGDLKDGLLALRDSFPSRRLQDEAVVGDTSRAATAAAATDWVCCLVGENEAPLTVGRPYRAIKTAEDLGKVAASAKKSKTTLVFLRTWEVDLYKVQQDISRLLAGRDGGVWPETWSYLLQSWGKQESSAR